MLTTEQLRNPENLTEMRKKASLVFPGISRVYKSREIAARHFYDFHNDKQHVHDESKKRYLVLFKIKIDGALPPMSVQKALNGEKLGIQCHANNEE